MSRTEQSAQQHKESYKAIFIAVVPLNLSINAAEPMAIANLYACVLFFGTVCGDKFLCPFNTLRRWMW